MKNNKFTKSTIVNKLKLMSLFIGVRNTSFNFINQTLKSII